MSVLEDEISWAVYELETNKVIKEMVYAFKPGVTKDENNQNQFSLAIT